METSISKRDIKKISQIVQIIKQSKTFFIAGHVKPDGDSIGSGLALYLLLKRLKKQVKICCADEIPPFLTFLTGVNKIQKKVEKNENFDCAIILESVNLSRMGDIISKNQAKKFINIDHHKIFTNFGDVNYIVANSSSVSELILNIFEHMKIKPTKDEAQALYVGLLTDTGRFQQLNTTQNSHIAAAKLMGYGVDQAFICKKVYESNSLESLKLLGLTLANIKTAFDVKFAYLTLTKDMLKKTGAKETELDALVNYTLTINGVVCGALFKEVDKNNTKISFRSVKNFNLLDIVKRFDGGGHKNACGCSLNKNINTSIKIIKKAIKEKINV